MQRLRITLGLMVGIVLAAGLSAQEPAKTEKKPVKEAKEAQANFERLKKLVGEWQLVDAKDEASKGKVMSIYRLTAGGTAIAETIMPNSDMEMLSVYHADGDNLVLTHYCCAGNQPRMRAKAGADKDELVFEFAGGSNLDPAKDGHIHNGKIRFVDADHLQSEWEFYADGKPAGKHSFDLVRKK
jgi:hypothetical protein